jgi:hypothetical protein
MSDGFTIGAVMGEPTIFECPVCKETIDSKAETCRFCGVKVDHLAAQRAAALMARINQACSDASNMRLTALTVPIVGLFGLVGGLATLGFLGLSIAILVWASFWREKYGEIESEDADFRKARATVKWTRIGVSVIVGLLFILPNAVAIAIRLYR